MNKRPLIVISISYIFGIVLARFVPDSIKFFHIFIVTLSFILFSFVFSSRRAGLNLPYGVDRAIERTANIFLLLSVVFFAGLLYLNCNTFPSSHITHFLKEGPLNTGIVGIVKGPALARGTYFGKINSAYLFEIEAVKDKGEWQRASGLSHIRIQTEKDYRYGDRLVVKGTIKRPIEMPNPKFQNPNKSQLPNDQNPKPNRNNNFNYREYLEQQNIFALISTKENNVTILSRDYKSNPILKYAYLVRERLKDQFLEKMPIESGAFMRAILLGDRSELPKKLNESFRNSGTMHILAISGLHVGLIAAFFLYSFRFMRVRREFSYPLTMLFLVFLMLLTGSRPSVVRAVIMCVIFLIGMLLGRGVDPYNTLAIAALFILIKNPKDVFNVGFQLSFLAVLSMVYFTPRSMRLFKEGMNIYVRKYLWSPLIVSISASIGTFPLILCYFRMIVPISVISNIFIVPLMFVLMIGGLGFSALGWVPLVGELLARFSHILATAIFFLAELFSGIKFGHFYV